MAIYFLYERIKPGGLRLLILFVILYNSMMNRIFSTWIAGIMLSFFMILGLVIVHGQTKIIALKSHSGQISAFDYTGADNLGLPPMRIKTVTWLSDTSVALSYTYGYFQNDTVYHHHQYNNPEISLDSLKKLYPEVSFIGFDKKPYLKTSPGGKKKHKKGFFWLTAPAGRDLNNGAGLLATVLFGLMIILAVFIYKSTGGKAKPFPHKI